MKFIGAFCFCLDCKRDPVTKNFFQLKRQVIT